MSGMSNGRGGLGGLGRGAAIKKMMESLRDSSSNSDEVRATIPQSPNLSTVDSGLATQSPQTGRGTGRGEILSELISVSSSSQSNSSVVMYFNHVLIKRGVMILLKKIT